MRLEFIFSNSQTIECGKNWRDYMAALVYIPNSITVASEDLLKLVSNTYREKIVSGVEQYDNP